MLALLQPWMFPSVYGRAVATTTRRGHRRSRPSHGSSLAGVLLTLMLLQMSFTRSTSPAESELGSQGSAHPIRDHRILSGIRPGATSNHTAPLLGNYYLRDTYIRTNLKENKTGIPLSLTISVLDSVSCSPVENALVELWGADSRGMYSSFGSDGLPSGECASWLRGAQETDASGVVKFETLYPGGEENRALHLYAIVRTDWFEHSKNRTVDSDASRSAAVVGQIFFPNSLNSQVLQSPRYKSPASYPVDNEQDRLYASGRGVWTAKAHLVGGDLKEGVNAQVKVSVDAHAPQEYDISGSPYFCRSGGESRSLGDNNRTIETSVEDPNTTSDAHLLKSSKFLATLFIIALTYNIYQCSAFF